MKANAISLCLIALVALNLALTAGLYFREEPGQSPSHAAATRVSLPSDLPRELVDAFADNVVDLYNRDDFDGLYELFDELAKVELSRETLRTQLEGLAPIVGRIDSFAFASVAEGDYEGRPAYELRYRARLRDGPFESGSMKISLLNRDGKLRLLGFRVNGETK